MLWTMNKRTWSEVVYEGIVVYSRFTMAESCGCSGASE